MPVWDGVGLVWREKQRDVLTKRELFEVASLLFGQLATTVGLFILLPSPLR